MSDEFPGKPAHKYLVLSRNWLKPVS